MFRLFRIEAIQAMQGILKFYENERMKISGTELN